MKDDKPRSQRTQTNAPKPAADAQRKRRGYRGLTAEQLQQQREDRLVAAAIELFGDQGYAAVSIEKLCSHARVSTRHFYEQFNGRESILYTVHDALAQQMAAIMRRVLTESRTPMNQRVAETIEDMVLFLLEDPRHGRILCIESVGVSAAMESRRRAASHQLADVINRYASNMARRDILPARDYRLPSIALVGMFNELIVEWLVDDTGLTAQEMAREIKILFRAMVFGAQYYRASEDLPPQESARKRTNPNNG